MIYFIATVMSILSFTSIFGYSVGGVRHLSTPYILIVIPTVFITTLYMIAFVGFLVDSKENEKSQTFWKRNDDTNKWNSQNSE